ncbi:MAG: ABC transporter substrate-binding protein [Alphaproteobacteria bacterium]|nr:ABC transporter substrate-binding protein [Alphaproteobacteria bacterium]
MKKAILSMFAVVMLMTSTAAAVTPSQAKEFIEKLISEGILFWKDKPYDEQVVKFREVMETKFDLDGIAKRTIGEKLWGYMDANQQSKYVAAFRQMLLNRYSKKFSNYGGQDIIVMDAVPSMKMFPIGVDSPTPQPQIVVVSELRNSGGSPTKIEWFVGEENGKPTITDITMAGPSMVSTEQATFTAIQRSPENLKNARETCKSAGAGLNKCVADQLAQAVMNYMLSSN